MQTTQIVQKTSLYGEVESIINQLKQQRVVPTLDRFVYAKRDLCEEGSNDPRYQVSVMIKKFY